MSWSFGDLFQAPRLFKRPEHNSLMLGQYLAGLEARYIVLASKEEPQDQKALDEVGKVIARYRQCRAPGTDETAAPLPDWNEAFLAELVLDQLLHPDEARGELALQLAALKAVDATTHGALSTEWEEATKGGAEQVGRRVRALLVSARRSNQWENTQRWVIRTLGVHYAARLRTAFLLALAFAVVLVVAEVVFGPSMQSAALSGLGFATAAGLLGASFSAMVGQDRVFKLHSVEEARAATSKQMIALRLGVGVAAAIIVYFFFESGLVEGALFPDLQQIGFGRIIPIGDEFAALRANAQALEQSAAALIETIGTVNERIAAVMVSMPQDGLLADRAADVQKTAFGAASGLDTDFATGQLKEKLQVTGAELTRVSDQIGALQAEWALGSRPLGSLAPNPDLSKLVVWCFAAGFTQTLVPALLAKVAPQDKPSDSAEG